MMAMRKPSDYAHAFGEPVLSHWDNLPLYVGEPVEPEPAPEPAPEPMELATFRLLYESDYICLFETRDGHITSVNVNRLA